MFKDTCAHCGEKITGNEAVCPHCGTPRGDKKSLCAHCGKEAPATAKFCPACGHALAEINSKKKTGQSHGNRNLKIWIPIVSLFLMTGICLLILTLSKVGNPADLLASEIETIVAGDKPNQALAVSPTVKKIPTQTATSIPTRTETNTPTLTPTPLPVPPVNAKLKDIWVSPMDGMVLIYIPQGQYLIGSLDSDLQALIDEKPQHKVDLHSFWMDKTEVTNAMYALCVHAGACQPKKIIASATRNVYYGEVKFDNYPVIYVTWSEAQAYCAWAGRKLPTEAQWEAAARGSDRRIYPWGTAAPSCNLVNYAISVPTNFGLSTYCKGDTTAAGMYPLGASPYGVLDMAGNVWEWVTDWKGPNYLVEPHQDPSGMLSGEYRVIRGGAYFNDAKYLRTAMRAGHNPDDPTDTIGFRCSR